MPRPRPLDWIACGLLVLGLGFAAFGALPAEQVAETWHRVAPLLLFLVAVVVLAELTAGAEVFDVVAARMAVLARGRYAVLFVLCVLLASLCTMVLNLDTTAVLLTPVMLALATRVGIAALPMAMTTVWLANTASLVLPVSNLTNLLAFDRLGLTPLEWAARMWLPQLVAVVVTMAVLWGFFWRRGARGAESYDPEPPPVPRDRVLFHAACAMCACFVAGVLVDVPLHVVAPVCAAVLVAVHALADRSRLRWSLVPWRLLAMVPGLFLVVGTIGAHGLDDLMGMLIGTEAGGADVVRTAVTGVVSANAVNNLPAYLAGEVVAGPAGPETLLALLVGVNVGSVITPWASLATVIWFERCHTYGVRISLRVFAWTGTVLAVIAVLATSGALIVTAP